MTLRYSIVIVSYNGLGHLQACVEAARLCLESEAQRGDAGEIIVVDNASRDGTPSWLPGQRDIQSILNPDNRGFSVACNQGAELAAGEYLLFLNPDTWMTTGCLRRMASHFADGKVGAVGPLSNYVAGLQRLDLQWPEKAEPLAEIAAKHQDGRMKAALIAGELAAHRDGQYADTRLLIGFCLMMRRRQFASMGGMDADLFLGNDDLDLSWRLREQGFQLRVALDAFVLHEGQKSFATEPKTKVDKWVQESTDALYLKLVRHYGGADKVPPAKVLWGMDWFRPSPDALQKAAQPNHPLFSSSSLQEAPMPQALPQASLLSDITLLIPVFTGEGHEAALQATLAEIPDGVGEIILLDGRMVSEALPAHGHTIRRLDIGPDMPTGLALRMASRAAKKPYILCLPAGLQITALAAHWLGRQDPQDLPAVLPLHVAEKAGAWRGAAKPCLLLREIWLREPPTAEFGWAEICEELQRKAPQAERFHDMPWLGVSPGAVTLWKSNPIEAEKGEDWTPVAKEERISLYPESLQSSLRQAQSALFAGSATSPVKAQGPVRGVDMNGQDIQLADQDLLVLRLTPDMLDDLPERLNHIRRSARKMRHLIVLFNGRQALGKTRDAVTGKASIDLTPEGVSRALQLSGFEIKATCPYHGFPSGEKQGQTLHDWYQIEAVPRRSELALDKKVSVVILGFNQCEYTRKCIASIRRHTRQSIEWILIDNGSQDATWEMFAEIPGAKTVRHAENLGVAAGWNSGLRLATGDYVCILNNDTLVGEGWLENMVRLCESDAAIGLVGPRCNRIAGTQVVEKPDYRSENEIPDFIAGWNHRHALQYEDHDWVKGVCMLMPRAVVEKVGFFDERFGKGNFEDDDYCLRVRMHGYKTLIAHDSYLHHFGSVSFNQAGIDWTEQMTKNKALFDAKWARGKVALNDIVLVDRSPAIPSAGGSAPVGGNTAEANPEMRRRLDKVQESYDKGDLNQARHDLLEAAALDAGHPDVLNAMGIMRFHDGDPREAALCFIKSLLHAPTHEDAARNLLDALLALNGEISSEEMAAFRARFPGNAVFLEDAQAMDWRQEIEACIAAENFSGALQRLEPHLAEPERRSACFNYMGIIANLLDSPKEGVAHFQRALQENPVEPDAVLNAAEIMLSQEMTVEAAAIIEKAAQGGFVGLDPSQYHLANLQCRRALKSGKPDAARLRRELEAGEEAEALLEAGKSDAARSLLAAHLRLAPDDFRAHNNLGLCAFYAGQTQEALAAFERALQCEPGCGDALINACDCALSLGRSQGLPALAKKTLQLYPDLPESKRIRNILAKEGDSLAKAGSLAEIEAQHAMVAEGEEKLRQGDKVGARENFMEAIARRAENPQALNGLGMLAFGESRFDEAYAYFQKAAALHPPDQDILLNLWESACRKQCEPEALGLLKDSLNRNPDLTEVRAIVSSAV